VYRTEQTYAMCKLPKNSQGVNGVLKSESPRADREGGVLAPSPQVSGVGE